MKPSAPKMWAYWVGIVAGLVGAIASYIDLGVVSDYGLLLLVVGWLVLALGTSFKGM